MKPTSDELLRLRIQRLTEDNMKLRELLFEMQYQQDSIIDCTNDTITELVRLLRLAVNDIDRLINVSCFIRCADIIETNSICFMGGTIQGRNTWIHHKEAEEILNDFKNID